MNRSQQTARIVAAALEEDRLERQEVDDADLFDPSEEWDLFRIRDEEEREAEERDAMLEAEYDDLMREDDSWDRYDYSVYDPYDFV